MDRRIHIALAALIAVTVVALLTGVVGQAAAFLTGDREHIRRSLAGLGLAAPFASIGLNVLQGVVAPIPGFVVPFINGMVFGTWPGMLITWIGGIAAASACFGISRTFGRGVAEGMCRRFVAMERANHLIERHGLGAIVLARSLPGMPFDAFSYLGGLSRVSYRRFVLGTAIGSAPHALAYSLMGSHLAVPLWMGLALTPLVGLTVAAIHCGVRRARRTPAAAVVQVADSPSAPALTVGLAFAPTRGSCRPSRVPAPASNCAPRAARCPTGWRASGHARTARPALAV